MSEVTKAGLPRKRVGHNAPLWPTDGQGNLCRVRRCCNPAHLEPVTDLVNMRRGMSPGAIAQRRDVCFHGVHDYATHGVTYKDGRRHCRECDRIRASLWSRMSVEERSERKAAGLPIVDLAAHYAEQAAA